MNDNDIEQGGVERAESAPAAEKTPTPRRPRAKTAKAQAATASAVPVEPLPFVHWAPSLKLQATAAFLEDVKAEMQRSREARPGNRWHLAKVSHHVGNLSGLLYVHGAQPADLAVYQQAVCVAAAALRLAIEGDGTFMYAWPALQRGRS